MKPKNKILAAAVLSTAMSGTALAVLPVNGPAEAWTVAQIWAMAGQIEAELVSFSTALNLQLINKFDQMAAAIAVATAQESASSNEIQATIRATAERFAAVARTEDENNQVIETVMSYNPGTGQGYDPCGTSAKNRTLDRAFTLSHDAARVVVNGDFDSATGTGDYGPLDIAPGNSVGSITDGMNQRMVFHRVFFCTQPEADAGLCSLQSDERLHGADVNANMLFEPIEAGSLHEFGRRGYIQNVMGLPDAATEYWASGTNAGQEHQQLKNRKDALASIPLNSLAMISAANTRQPIYQGQSLSPNEVLTARVNQYFGGAEAQQWSGSIARQSERGLIVEANKMMGLGVWLRHKQYEQNQRLELNLAALLVTRVEAEKQALDREYGRATKGDAGSQVQ